MLILLILIPFSAALLSLGAWGRPAVQRGVAAAGGLGLLLGGVLLTVRVLSEGVLVQTVGAWPAPFGITLVADPLAAVLVTLTGLIALCGVLFSLPTIGGAREAAGYYPLYNLLIMGVTGAFLAGDLFNLYVWFEVLLMASFVLIALGGERAQLEGAIKYVALNLLGSVFFLAAAGLVYGLVGTLNMAHIAVRMAAVSDQGMTSVVAVLLLCAFGIKAAVFPLFFWLPASYHTPPVAVTAVFSALLTKVGVYAIVRTFTLMFVGDSSYTHTILLVLAALTMMAGVLGAVAQMEIRRLLSFHIVSQIGYLLMGIGLQSIAGVAATVVFLAHVIVAKAALFFVGGIIHRDRGTTDLPKLGGLLRQSPLLSILFVIPALALAGLPPLSGFWAKLYLVRAGFLEGEGLVVTVALAVSVLTLFSMMKIWNEAFWKPAPPDRPGAGSLTLSTQDKVVLYSPAVVLVGLTVAMGIAAGPVYEVALKAAEQLMSPQLYIAAVLGGGH